ncbi:Large cysteine-rich periplasmic protein OmcB precursor [Aquisphaera giovannonii]|uniref:Large cysteine-rich periplasmic protein OmcB n=1 Tax=Aquisphaera giovannonii TaxID=406548 RepID=A0A5B9VUP0_9BACT|nr:Calx-beta domain-containing protein [Aquisphaera giovannonii]QEH31992.1 Large cysteine-rich periplasmic protein OmcB precursor [Aquisphaera giovannonii]
MFESHRGLIRRRPSSARGRRRGVAVERLERRELLATFLVQNVNDDLNSGSLRWALTQAQADSDPTSLIKFQIGGAGVKTIPLGSPLPTVSHPTTIDGTSQGAYAGTPLVELDASALKSTDAALTVTAGGSTVKALAINGCPGTAILLDQGGGNVVAACTIGTTADGSAAKANGVGIAIANSSNNTIGGTAAGAGNVIAGNTGDGIRATAAGATGEVIQGNLIGVSRVAAQAGLSLGAGFDGLQFNDTIGWVPPEPRVAVGNSLVMETVNTTLRISNRDGTTVSTTDMSAFFPNAVADDLIPQGVFYDEIAGRFVVFAMETNSSASTSFLDVAFSDAGNESSFSAKYRISVKSGSDLAFEPKFGYNADAVALSFNMYTGGTTYAGVQLLSIATSSIGAASLTTATVSRPDDYTLIPASMHGATAGQPMYFVEADPQTSSSNKVHVLAWANPLNASSAFTDSVVTVAAYSSPPDASQAGSGSLIYTSDAYIQSVAWRDNRLVATQTIASGGVAAARWYEFSTDASTPSATPTLAQSGTVTRPGGAAVYYPAMDIDAAGDLGMTFMSSSSTEYMSMYVTGQVVGATAGSMLAPTLARAGQAPYTPFDPAPYAAGYNSSITLDPAGGTFWAASEYAVPAQDGANWGTWIQGFSLSSAVSFTYKAMGNGGSGILLNGASGVVIGGTAAGAGNVIGANGADGVRTTGGSSGTLIQGNYIGTNASGDATLGNVGDGLNLQTDANTVGGTTLAALNVVSGNKQAGIAVSSSAGNLIQGNYVGVLRSGAAALANGDDGILVTTGTGTTIGGTVAGAGNLVSGNGGVGIHLNAAFTKPNTTGTLIAGNLVGVNASGTAAIPNKGVGIFQDGADATTIGGTAAAARNVVSGNGDDGISMGPGDHSLVVGNYVGTDITGTLAIANKNNGLDWTGASYATVGGTTAAARNVISGNAGGGINSFVVGDNGHELIQGNYIGVDVTGGKALPNGATGVRIAGPTNNTIGGTTAAAANVISGNGKDGIEFTVGTAAGTVVQGNYIGTNAAGATNLGNAGTGIVIWSDDVTIGGTAAGAGNVIAYNKGGTLDQGDGIRFIFDVHHNSILSNSIHDNAGLGINFGNGPTPNHVDGAGATPGPNDYQNYPVIASAVIGGGGIEIKGTLNAGASASYLVQFFWSPAADPSGYGEGQYYIGSATVTTGADHNGSFDAIFPGVDIPGGSAISATATDASGNTSEFSADVETVVIADVSIAGSASSASSPAHAGDTLTYTFTVSNSGPDPAHGVVFSDTLPASLAYVGGSWTSSVGGVTPTVSGQSITAALPTIPVGGSVVLTFQVTTLAAATPSVSNTASVTTTDQDPDPANDSATVTTTVDTSADLAVTSLAVSTAGPYYAGQSFTYAFTVINKGPSTATGVQVVDTLPAGLTFVSASGGGTYAGGKVTFSIPSLSATASASYTVTVTPGASAAEAPVVNVVSVGGSDFDPDHSNDSAQVSTTVLPSADLSVAVVARDSGSNVVTSALAGQTLTYTITASNGNLSDATGVVVKFTLPAGATFVSATGGATPTGGVITFPSFSLAANGSQPFTVQVKAAAVSTSTATAGSATISGGQHDPDGTNNNGSAAVTVQPLSDLGVAVVASSPRLYVGESLTYTITVTNAGPSTDTAVRVVDTLPAGMTVMSAVSSVPGVAPAISGNTVTADLGQLGVTTGLPTLPTITIVAVPSAAATGNVTNTVTITGVADPSDSTARAATEVDPSADLAVSLSAPSSVLVHGQLHYTLTVTNKGPSAATGIQLVDALPPGVQFVSATGGVTPDADGHLTFQVASLPAAAGANAATFDVIVIPQLPAVGATISSTATVAAVEHDPAGGNNAAAASTKVNPAVDLAVSRLSASPDPVVVGSTLTVTYVVTNNGPSPATNVRVAAPMASGMSFGGGSASPSGTVSAQGSSVVAVLGTLAPGASATVTFTVTPGAVGGLTTSATATATEQDPDSSNNAASVTTTVLDRLGTIAFAASSYSVDEGAGSATITVSRVDGTRGTVSVDYRTVAVNATPGLDFTPVSGTLTFGPGETSKTITVPVLANPWDAVNEVLDVVLGNVRSADTPGQALAGTPSTTRLTIVDTDPNTTPLAVSAFQWTGAINGISQVLVTFNKPLMASAATDASNYLLQSVGADGKYGTGDESRVPVAAAYDPSTFTVTLTPTAALPANTFFHISLKGSAGGLEDLGGNELTGDGATAGTDYTAMFARGTSLRYYTPTNDLVTLTLARGGVLDDLLTGNGQGQRLTVVNRVARKSVLSGSVKTLAGKNGQAYLGETIWGLGRFGDVRVKMHAPQFLLNYYPFSPGSRASQMGTRGPVTVTSAASAAPAARVRALHAMSRPFHAFRR